MAESTPMTQMNKSKLSETGLTIYLLTVVDSSHDAEVWASTLRNAGYAVRPTHVSNVAALDDALKQENWDLMLCAPQIGNDSAALALEKIVKSGRDLPCIVFGAAPSREQVLNLSRFGAARVISGEETDYLLLVIDREMKALNDRRKYRECRLALGEIEKRNRTLMDSSREPIAYLHEGMHIYANYSYVELFGYSDAEEMESIPIMDLISGEQQQAFKQLLRSLSKGETPEQDFEFDAIRQDGESFKAKMAFSAAAIDGEPCTQIVIRRDMPNEALEKELDQLRKQDLLTGLFNRQHFMDLLNDAVKNAISNDSSSVLFYIEPENFKSIKDALGIEGSDIVLTDIAKLLKDSLPGNVVLARFAGTIFTALFSNTTIDDVSLMADQILDSFAHKDFEVDGKTVTTTCSIGITQISETTSNAKKALANADAASILAKEKQGRHIHIHTVADEMASLEQDRAWADRINLALQQNRFTLHFQPIVSLHAEPGERYEVFVRMLDNEDQLILPNEFMEAAEHAGLSGDLDRWILKNSAKSLLEKRRDGFEIRFFIKLSYDSVIDPGLLPWISKLLKAARLHGSSLVFEVSEHIASNNIKTTKQLISGLKQLNCLFAIDHVGSESENLSYLSNFTVNYLKIDGSIVQSVTRSEAAQESIKNICEMARNREILTIAEHVQDPACLAILWQHGINFIQGYYLQKPEAEMDYDFNSGH